MYSKIYLRLEPLGLALVAEAARRAGHQTRIIDLQVDAQSFLLRTVSAWRPDVVLFSCNYLPNVPEIIDLAKAIKGHLPKSYVVVGGHCASFTANEFLAHGAGAIDGVLTGEGESNIVPLLEGVIDGCVETVPGAVTPVGTGPPPTFVESLDDLTPARDLLHRRRKYFIGAMDPCASIEFSRGCPWDCAFCSAWTFYGRSYRLKSPEASVEEVARIKEPGLFIVDDVAFIHGKHAMEIGEAIAQRNIKKQYYLETRGDVLLRNKEVFEFWRDLGLKYMFLGVEAIDEDGLKKFRKRVSLSKNFEALEFARSLGVKVAINIIAEPDWDERQFEVIRNWCQEIPEIVNISVNTPYPGTETWVSQAHRLTTRDYRLFDIQHAVLPTKLPLEAFYRELVNTQRVLNRKHLGMAVFRSGMKRVVKNLARGQTNFVRMLWKFNSVYDPALQLADHRMPVTYELSLPRGPANNAGVTYVHAPKGRKGRAIDNETERFVDQTRMTKT